MLSQRCDFDGRHQANGGGGAVKIPTTRLDIKLMFGQQEEGSAIKCFASKAVIIGLLVQEKRNKSKLEQENRFYDVIHPI